LTPAKEPVKTVPINLCEPGDVLAEDIHNNSGQKVISSDTKLSSTLIKRLVGSGIRRVKIYGTRDDYPAETSETQKQKSREEPVTRERDGREVIVNTLRQNYISEGDVILEGNLESGAVLTARGDVNVLGEIRNGIVRALSGSIEVEGNIQSDGNIVQLISNNPIQVSHIENSTLSVRGSLIIDGRVDEARIDCQGNVVVHSDHHHAVIRNSRLDITGKLLADRVVGGENRASQLEFQDPELIDVRRNRNKTENKLEQLYKEAKKLNSLIETVKELGDKVKSLPTEQKEKVKKHTREFRTLQGRIKRANEDLEQYQSQMNSLRDHRRFFMRVLERLQADTSISFEDSELNVKEDEEDVILYKKGMIVIKDASDDTLEIGNWL